MVAGSKRGIDPENNLCWEKCRVRITRLQTAALSHEVTFRCKSPIQQTYNTLTQQVTLYFSCFPWLELFQLNKSPSIASSYGYSPWPINCSDPQIEQDRETSIIQKEQTFAALTLFLLVNCSFANLIFLWQTLWSIKKWKNKKSNRRFLKFTGVLSYISSQQQLSSLPRELFLHYIICACFRMFNFYSFLYRCPLLTPLFSEQLNTSYLYFCLKR